MLVQVTILIVVLLLLVLAVSRWNVHPFIALLMAAISLGLCLGMGGVRSVEVLLDGFSNTLKWIAVVVILGAFIGEVLRETGGALRIANATLKWLGEKRIPWAMGLTGYLVSIPVFVDVAYIVLQPVTEALSVRSKKPILVVGLSLAAGLTVSHTLLPPTPGPLAVASLLEANVGRMLLINGFVGLLAMGGGILWAIKYCQKFRIPYDDKLQMAQKSEPESARTEKTHSWVLWDLLPILIPILLMGLGAFLSEENGSLINEVISFLSIPMVAVAVGCGIAFLQYIRSDQKTSSNILMEQAIVKSALVIMITGAGGAFGYIIRESGIQNGLADFFATLPYLGFLLPFLIGAVLTTATGSITVSLIGTASIVGPMAGSMPFSPEMMAALIGCGSFCVFHANSSFFWLLNRLHHVPVNILYRTFTLQSLIMGLFGLGGVSVLYLLGVR